MQAEGSIFLRDTEFCQCCVDGFCQSGQHVLCFYSDPENSCGSWRWEETGTAEADLKWFGLDRPERRFNLRDYVVRLFAYKFQGDVQRFAGNPTNVGCGSTNFFHEFM